MPQEFWQSFWRGLMGTVVYGTVGLLLLVFGYKLFDWITPKIELQKELAEKHNIAVAIVCAAAILGVCYIVATVSH